MKFKQSILVINFKPDISDEEQQEIVSDFYIKYEKQIIGMNALNLKDNINKFKKKKKFAK